MENALETNSEFKEHIVHIARVAKVVKGGRRFSFSALIVVGDGSGRIGYGLGKANEVPEAIRKGGDQAKKNLIKVPLDKSTIPHYIEEKYGAAKVVLIPAAPGTGVIAGGPVRAVMELVGVKDVLTKSFGSNNPHNVIRATVNGLKRMQTREVVFEKRGISLE